MPETRVTIAGRVHRLDIAYREKAYLIVEVECTAEGTHSTKSGDVPTRKITVSDALRLNGDLPVEMLEELRRVRRDAEGEETGIDVIPGLEGFLDGNGVVVTEADQVEDTETWSNEQGDEWLVPAGSHWQELGERVHVLREQVAGGGTPAKDAQVTLDLLWSELNEIVEGDVVEDSVIIDEEGNERAPIELPHFEAAAETAPDIDDTPFEGYEDLNADEVIDRVDDYSDADADLGGPSPESRAWVANVQIYEAAHGARAKILRALLARLQAIDDALGSSEPLAALPWDGYDKSTADSIIGHLKAVAEREGDDAARALIPAVESYESANKNRKGILGRLATIVPPILPDGPDLELELDEDDEFEPDEDDVAVEDTRDIADLEE